MKILGTDFVACLVSDLDRAVADIQAAFAELNGKPVTILRPPYELSYCWHREILDPDANMVIIHQRKDRTVGQQKPGTQS